MTTRVPIRLLVHFQTAARPLAQISEGTLNAGRVIGAGTRAIDLTGADLQLFDPATGQPLGETIAIDRALIILYSLTKR